MREQLLDILRCPACRAEQRWDLEVSARDEREVRAGTLICGECRRAYPIEDGIVGLLHHPPEHVLREAAGLERFAQRMREDGWDRRRIRALPYVEDGYWYHQAVSLEQLLSSIDFLPGQRLLDVGSNTCWASNIFARRGLEVIALDIATVELQGLSTAEYFLETGEVYFERLLSIMTDPAIAGQSLDYVFCSEVLHHNDGPALGRTLRELHRILKPGGRLLINNETMKFPLNLKRDHAAGVAEFEGNEHCHFFHQYYLAARRAGFAVKVRKPPYLPFYSGVPTELSMTAGAAETAGEVIRHGLRRTRVGRRLYMGYKTLLAGDVGLNLVCTKPAAGA